MTHLSAGMIGNVRVMTASGRGFTPEEIAERAVDRIISIGDTTCPELAVQARAFKQELNRTLVFYLKEMVSSHNTTLTHRLNEAGHHELVRLLEP